MEGMRIWKTFKGYKLFKGIYTNLKKVGGNI